MDTMNKHLNSPNDDVYYTDDVVHYLYSLFGKLSAGTVLKFHKVRLLFTYFI